MRYFLVFTFLAILLSGTGVRADSDGNYCIGKNYVAIETRGIWMDAPEPSVAIVTINPEGVLAKHVLTTPNNQNKKLRCEKSRILFSDGTVIDLSDFETPLVKKTKAVSELEYSTSQLPYLRSHKVIELSTTDKSHFYSLILNHNVQTTEQGLLLHHISARVVKVFKNGDFADSKLLAEGVRFETVH